MKNLFALMLSLTWECYLYFVLINRFNAIDTRSNYYYLLKYRHLSILVMTRNSEYCFCKQWILYYFPNNKYHRKINTISKPAMNFYSNNTQGLDRYIFVGYEDSNGIRCYRIGLYWNTSVFSLQRYLLSTSFGFSQIESDILARHIT